MSIKDKFELLAVAAGIVVAVYTLKKASDNAEDVIETVTTVIKEDLNPLNENNVFRKIYTNVVGNDIKNPNSKAPVNRSFLDTIRCSNAMKNWNPNDSQTDADMRSACGHPAALTPADTNTPIVGELAPDEAYNWMDRKLNTGDNSRFFAIPPEQLFKSLQR